MMSGKSTSSSSSSSKTTSSGIDDKTLLKFYQKKFEEHQRKEDRYKDKIDKHLKQLVTDRHELEEEVIKRGEKISDLQKALVELQLSIFEERERFLRVSAENEELKRNEEQLHANIRQLLAMTHQQDLRDRIIYILKDPKVQVGYRTDYGSKSKSIDKDFSANKKLREEIEYLQKQLDEVLQVSRSKADVVLEDCRQALEKSKEKILQDEIIIRELQNRLSDLNVQKSSSTRSWPSVIDPPQKSSSSRILPSSSESLNVQKSSSSRFAPAASESLNVQKSSSSRVLPESSESLNVQKSSSSRFAPAASESLNVQKSSSSRVLPESSESLNVHKSSSSRFASAATESLNVQKRSSSRVLPAASESLNVQKSSSRFVPSTSESLNAQKSSSSGFVPSSSESLNVQKSSSSKVLPGDSKSLNVQKSSLHKNLATSSQLSKTTSDDSFGNICSNLKDIHLSLILLLKIISKVTNILNSIQATKLYQRFANIPKPPYDMQPIVEENSIKQLETFLRQSTRLTFDTNNILKSVTRYISNNKKKMQNINELRSELNHLNDMLMDMTALTAENDLINVGLKRSSFFHALRDSSVNIQESERRQNIREFKKVVSNCETLYNIAAEAADFVESVIEKYNAKKSFEDTPPDYFPSSTSEPRESQEERSRYPKPAKSDSELISVKKVKSDTYKDLENLLRIYKRTVQEAENRGLGQSVETKLISEKLKEIEKEIEKEEQAMLENNNDFRDNEGKISKSQTRIRVSDSEKITRNNKEIENEIEKKERLKESDDVFIKNKEKFSEFQTGLRAFDCEEILRKIDKTLSKVEMIERGEYSKDEQLCKKLAENVNSLTKKFEELNEDFNVKSFQDQFSEYSRVTLGKLEELAKQSKNSVIAAEAQIAAHRSNSKNLSNKLKETEDLLRESINECLSLKQKLKQVEDKHEIDKYTLYSGLKEKLSKSASMDVVEKVMDELDVYITATKGTQADPYVCMYCQQGKGHKLCQEQIDKLRKEEQKSRTELKLLMGEAKNEKETFIHYRNIAEKAAADLSSTNEALKEEVKKMESKNRSLLEQLRLEKNRIKNMERFRRLEIEGFQTDIKNLKTKIKDLEKQLLKAVLIFENNNKDIDLLKTVHETALRSKQATVALRRLKAKLYELENDIKSL